MPRLLLQYLIFPIQVVSWLQFSTAAGHSVVDNLCRDFIAANFSRIADTIDFPNMEPETLAYFLARSDLVVKDEMEVFRSDSQQLFPPD